MRDGPALVAFFLGVTWLAAPMALADPPPWAPAHGYRKKHHDYERRGEEYQYRESAPPPYIYSADPYGILTGRCHRDKVLGAVGAATGGVLGAQIGRGGERALGAVLGAVVGYVLGSELGRQLDQADRVCLNNILEYGSDGRWVRWSNPDNGARYAIRPLPRHANSRCRPFVISDERPATRPVEASACRGDDGIWRMVHR